jgi:hypothetical protein
VQGRRHLRCLHDGFCLHALKARGSGKPAGHIGDLGVHVSAQDQEAIAGLDRPVAQALVQVADRESVGEGPGRHEQGDLGMRSKQRPPQGVQPTVGAVAVCPLPDPPS